MTKRSRPFQFSLRGFLAGLAVLGGLLGLVAWLVQPYQHQYQVGVDVRQLGGKVFTRGVPDWMNWLPGLSLSGNILKIDVAKAEIPQDLLEQLAALPELRSLEIGGTSITDSTLQTLNACAKLEHLVLDSTNVTPRGFADFVAAHPQLNILRCDNRIAGMLAAEQQYELETRTISDPFIADRPVRLISITAIRPKGSRLNSRPPEVPEFYSLLAPLTNLRELDLNADDLSPQQLETICSLPLTHLSLWGVDREQALDLSALARLQTLQELSLRGLPVTDRDLSVLKSLTSLRKLDLGDTAIDDPALWPELPLTALVLDDTLTDNEDLKSLRRYGNLEELALNFTFVTGEGLPDLSALPKLRSLQLRGTRILPADYDLLCKLPSLAELAIGAAPVSDAVGAGRLPSPRGIPYLWQSGFGPVDEPVTYKDDVAVRKFDATTFAPHQEDVDNARRLFQDIVDMSRATHLVYLDSPLNALHCDLLADQESIEVVDFSRSFVGDADLRHLAGLPHLKYLDLSDTYVTDVGLQSLTGCSQLTGLNLSGTRVTPQGIAQLVEHLPQLASICLPRSALRAESANALAKLRALRFVGTTRAWLRTAHERTAPDLTVADLEAISALAELVTARFDEDGDGAVSPAEFNESLESAEFSESYRLAESTRFSYVPDGALMSPGDVLRYLVRECRMAAAAREWMRSHEK